MYHTGITLDECTWMDGLTLANECGCRAGGGGHETIVM